MKFVSWPRSDLLSRGGLIKHLIGSVFRHYRLDVPKFLLTLFGVYRSLVVIGRFANHQKDINPTNYAMPVTWPPRIRPPLVRIPAMVTGCSARR